MRLVASEVKVLPISGEMPPASIAEHLTTENLQDIIVFLEKVSVCAIQHLLKRNVALPPVLGADAC
jgi:hypothetical protein